MKDYRIQKVKIYSSNEGQVIERPVISEAELSAPDGTVTYVLLSDGGGIPDFLVSPESYFRLLTETEDPYESEEILSVFTKYGVNVGEYQDMFANPDPEWFDVFRYLVSLNGMEMHFAQSFIQETEGKLISEITIPATEFEEKPAADQDFTAYFDSIDDLYKARLTAETDAAMNTVFHILDSDGFRLEQDELRRLIEFTKDEEDYKAWKEAFIEKWYHWFGLRKFFVYTYRFADQDTYSTTVAENEVPSFEEWLRSSRSISLENSREANEAEVREYIAVHATGLD